MKKYSEKYFLGGIIGFSFIVSIALFLKVCVIENRNKSVEKNEGVNIPTAIQISQNLPVAVPVTSNLQRENVTFILGEDGDNENNYYSEATHYYRLEGEEVTGSLVTHCRSLEEVRNYLFHYKPENDQAWGMINLVMHANEFNGLGVSLFDAGPRATTASIQVAIEQGMFKSLPDEIMDRNTEIILTGCGLGRNQAALDAIAKAFGGEGDLPIVRSTRYFVYYESTKIDGQAYEAKKYLADYWYAFYKTGYRPGDIRLSRQLEKRHPKAAVDFRDALSRTRPRWIGDTYHYTFKVPVTWWVTYPSKEERPDLKTEADKKAWLAEQEELQEIINAYGIPDENFQWTISKRIYTFEDGTQEPAIKAIGLCTILCVLQAITEDHETGAIPLNPSVRDTAYYAVNKRLTEI